MPPKPQAGGENASLHKFSEYPLSEPRRELARQQQLTKPLGCLHRLYKSLLDSLFGGITILGLLPSALLRRVTRLLAKNPLRCVVERRVEYVRTEWGKQGRNPIYHEILECGHPYSLFPILDEEFTAKRRRCAACGALAKRASGMTASGRESNTLNRAECSTAESGTPLAPPRKSPEPVPARALEKKAGA